MYTSVDSFIYITHIYLFIYIYSFAYNVLRARIILFLQERNKDSLEKHRSFLPYSGQYVLSNCLNILSNIHHNILYDSRRVRGVEHHNARKSHVSCACTSIIKSSYVHVYFLVIHNFIIHYYIRYMYNQIV